MQSLVSCEKRLSYKLTTVYVPASIVFLAFIFIEIAVFQSTGIFQSFLFIAVALICLWIATLFFEVVNFELNHEDDSVCLNRITFSRFRLIRERKVFRLSDLNCIWIEFVGSSSSRLTLRFSDAWLPLTSTLSETFKIREIELPIRSWLKARGLIFEVGEGGYPP